MFNRNNMPFTGEFKLRYLIMIICVKFNSMIELIRKHRTREEETLNKTRAVISSKMLLRESQNVKKRIKKKKRKVPEPARSRT